MRAQATSMPPRPARRARGPASYVLRALLVAALLSGGAARAAGADGANSGSPPYRHMELADFKERKGDIPGERIELSGWLVGVTGDAILFTDPGDRTGIIVDVSGLKPEERRRVRACTNACEAVVQGVAAKVRARNGLRAERVLVR